MRSETMKSLLSLAVLLLVFSGEKQADSLQDMITESQKLSPARLFSRDELLIKEEGIRVAKLSPDGRYLVFIIKQNSKQQLWLLDNDTGVKSKRFTSSEIRGLYWAGDSQNVFLHLKTGVAAVGISPTSKPSIVVNLDREKDQYFYGPDKGSPHHFYIWMKEKGTPEHGNKHVLYRVDNKGNKKPLYKGDAIVDFVAPSNGPILFISQQEENLFKIYELTNGKRREVYQCHFTDYCSLLSYQIKTNSLFVKGRGDGDLSKLIKLDPDSGKTTTIHQDPENRFDIGMVTFDNQSGSPIMTSYETDFFENYGLTKNISRHIDNIKQQLDSPIIRLQPELDAKYWLVSDLNPQKAHSRIYLYNLASAQLSQPLEDIINRLNNTGSMLTDDDLALRVAIQYKASDGMLLQGYVTLPRGLKPAKLPLVVVPHGGPFSRRTGGDTHIAQFLANRGYAVFEPNFRASKGFGRTYMKSSNRDFGDGRVQVDIIEGLEYVLSRGIGDRNRLAINGGSFGGFSTLAALSFTPELFKVGIAVAPATAMSKTAQYLSKNLKGRRKTEMLERFANRIVDINNPADLKRSYENSPDFHAAKITAPLYIIAGERDNKVSILNVRNYALKLESMGKIVTLLSAPNEGHVYLQPVAREAWFYLLEKALYDHIGGRMQKPLNTNVARFLKNNLVVKPVIQTKNKL